MSKKETIRSVLLLLLSTAFIVGVTPAAVEGEILFQAPRYVDLWGADREPRGIVAADLDGDGTLDLATADAAAGTVSLLLGQGGGDFTVSQTLVACDFAAALDAADLNDDGHLDLVVACRRRAALALLLTRPDGTFEALQELGVGFSPNDVLVVDVDGDGFLDLVSADQGSDSVTVLHGRGGGLFDPAASYPVGSQPLSVAAGDVDGDGALDLATANLMSSDVSVLRGDGQGGLLPAQHHSVGGGQAHSVAVADLDGDGFDDLACAVFTSEVTILLSNGDGSLQPPRRFPTGARVYDLVAADLTGDGHHDLVGGGINDFVTLEGLGDGSFAPFGEHGFRRGSHLGVEVTVGDFDADGRADVATCDGSLSDVGVFLNATLPPVVPGSVTIAAADFEDGLPQVSEGWYLESSGPTGRIAVVNGRLRMDASVNGTFVANRADWAVDLAGYRDVRLGLVHHEFGDEVHPLPDSFLNRADGDGIAISLDRTRWYTVLKAQRLDVGTTGVALAIDLDAEAARIRAEHDPGFGLETTMWIRFQQYDNYSHPSDGREWDDIELTGVPGEVTHLPPRPIIGVTPDAPVAEGGSVRLSVQSIGDPNPGDTHTFVWILGDGRTADGPGPLDHVYDDDGQYTVDLHVTDQDGLEGRDQKVVSVFNVAPVVDAGLDRSVDMEAPVDLVGTFLDPGVLDVHTVVWDFGDGHGAVSTLTPRHSYALPGAYTVSLSVDDGDGGVGVDTLQVTVAPVYRLRIDTLAGGPLGGPVGGPFSPTCATYRVHNLHHEPRGWSVSVDEDWLAATPGGGTLAVGGAEVVQVCLTPKATALAGGEHAATVTFLEPNGLPQEERLTLSIVSPVPSIPYSQTFDSERPGEDEGFTFYTSHPQNGRTTVVDGRLRMDVVVRGSYALNEAELTLDLDGASEVELRFFQADHQDEHHPLPWWFEGHHSGDGVSMSADGVRWYRLLNNGLLEVTSTGRYYTISLDAERDRVRASYDPGFGYGRRFRIRFQQYDNYDHPIDGRDWDDIQVTGLKTDLQIDPRDEVVARGPLGGPLDRDCQAYTLTNTGDDVLSWSASVDRAWLSLSGEEGSLAGHEATDVDVCWEAAALDRGAHEGRVVFQDDAHGWVQTREIEVVIQADGRVPYVQDYSSGLPNGDGLWELYSSDPVHGRIEVQNGRLRMDSNQNGYYSLNEAVLTLDLGGASGVQLSFFHSEHNDEIHTLPPSFDGHWRGDGVAVSGDGITWYTVLSGTAMDVGSLGQTLKVDLDAEVARIRSEHDSSFGYRSAFRIKFQQYDNYSHPTDGREWDDISVTATP